MILYLDENNLKYRDRVVLIHSWYWFVYCNSCYRSWACCQMFLCWERHTNEARGSEQFRYIKIQPQTIDLSTRLWGINTEFVGFVPESLVLRSVVWDWILIYRNWSIDPFTSFACHKADNCVKSYWDRLSSPSPPFNLFFSVSCEWFVCSFYRSCRKRLLCQTQLNLQVILYAFYFFKLPSVWWDNVKHEKKFQLTGFYSHL